MHNLNHVYLKVSTKKFRNLDSIWTVFVNYWQLINPQEDVSLNKGVGHSIISSPFSLHIVN